MFCEVILLRLEGLRLRPTEWPEPLRGRLRVSHMPHSICASRRTLREAVLEGEWVTLPIPLCHLFDPEFVDVVGDGFLLRGHVVNSREGRQYEHDQIWLVRPWPDPKGPPLPRFDPSKWMRKMPVDETTGNEKSVSEQWHKKHVRS